MIEEALGIKVGDIVSGTIYMQHLKGGKKTAIGRFENKRVELIYRDIHGINGYSFKLEGSLKEKKLCEIDIDEIHTVIRNGKYINNAPMII